jgi:methylenetetrahydrofolate dehydrogenase (NADP+)/methenyltetrahydrofolate cyclohydrolase
MKIDGNQVQESIKQRLQKQVMSQPHSLRLDIIYIGNNSVIETFTKLKQTFGEAIGVDVNVHTLQRDTVYPEVKKRITNITKQFSSNGLVIQLPLPDHLPTDDVLNEIPVSQDVDVLSDSAYEAFVSGKTDIIPPVAGAVKEVCTYYDVDIAQANTAVVGKGRLVGRPVIDWLQLQNKSPNVLTKGDDLYDLQSADIVISGAGDPHIITPEHIKEGVVLLDAGTSQSDGGTKGDIHPECDKKARLFAPVPGGVGPVTIACLFDNLIKLTESNQP